MKPTKTSDAQKRASMKWIAENTDRMTIQAPKGTKDKWRAVAVNAGQSLTQYVIQAVNERMEREREGGVIHGND